MNMLEAMNFRHACKVFDTGRAVSQHDRDAIIEFGRLSPSSFGIEPWHFLVIENPALREQLKPACWDQVQITTSTFIVIYLTRLPHNFRADAEFIRQRLWRRSLDEGRYQAFLQRVHQYLAEQNTLEWAKRQSYLALANMMTGAATLGIDSCPIEGFFADQIKRILPTQVDWSTFDITAIAAFGYRVNPQPAKVREPVASVVTIL